jgi:tetratricopeptide (TPR) repeat protein
MTSQNDQNEEARARINRLIQDGDAYAKQRKYDAAIPCYEESLEHDPSNVEARRGWAKVLKDRYRYDEATALLEEALSFAEGELAAETCVDLASVLAAACQYKDALTWCERALTAQPDHAQAHDQRGLILYLMNRYEEAERAVDEALRRSPDSAEFRVTMGRILLGQSQYDDALTWLREALEAAPASALVWEWLGHAYKAVNRREEALKAYQKAVECDKWFLAAYADIGDLYLGEKQYEEALAWYRRGLEIDPGYARAHRGIAIVWMRQERYAEATEACQTALRLDKRSARSHDLLGDIYHAMEKHEEAIAWFQRALEVDPYQSVEHDSIGRALEALGEQDQAIIEYQQALEVDPKDKPACVLLARAYQERQQYDEALVWCQRGLKIDPNYGYALNMMGLVYEDQGQLEEAVEAYQRAMAAAPKEPVFVRNLGDVRLAQGRFEEAVALYQQALKVAPKARPACVLLARAYRDRQQYDEALAWCQRGLEIDPNYEYALNLMGLIYEDQGRLEEAAEAYQRAMAVEPKWADPVRNLGDVRLAQGRFEEAVALYQQALEVDPEYKQVCVLLASAHRDRQQYEEALAWCQRGLEIDPNYGYALNMMGLVYEDQGQLEEAAEAYQRAIAAEPKWADPVHNLGDVQLVQGRFEEAVALYQQALEVDPKYKPACVLLARAYRDRQQYDQALVWCQRGLEIDPNYTYALTLMGLVYQDQGRLEGAADAFQRAMAAEPEEPVFVRSLGDVRLGQGQFDEAVALYQQALEIDPKCKWACGQLARAYRERQQYDQALAWCQRGLEIDPDYTYALTLAATICERSARTAEASEYRQRLARIAQRDAAAMLAQGWDAYERREFGEALPWLRQAVEMQPTSWDARYKLSWTHQALGRYEDALAVCERALDTLPGQQINIVIRKGFILLDLQRYEEVVDICDEILAAQPGHLTALELKAISYRQRENYAVALMIYDEALQHHPTHPWLRNLRFYALTQRGQPEDLVEARDGYEALLRQYPGHEDRWDRLSSLAEVYMRLGDFNRSLNLCHQVLDWDPKDEYTHYVLGQLHAELNQFKEAETHLRTSNATWPDASTSLVLGKVLEAQGRLQEAMNEYRVVVRRKQRFADSWAREACAQIGAVLAQLTSQHQVEGMGQTVEEIVSAMPDEPIEPDGFFYPASILCHFAKQGYNRWQEQLSRLVPIVEEIRRLLIEIERHAQSLVVGEMTANWDEWQRIQKLRRRAYPLSYDLFSYLQGYWDEPADVEERLQDVRDRMLADYWRLGIFELLPSLTIVREGDEPVIVRGVAAKVQALFRVLIRKSMELQAGQRPEVTVYIRSVRDRDARVNVQLAVPQQYRECVQQLYATRNLGNDPDWLLADHILEEYGGTLELMDSAEGTVGLQLELDKARARKHRGLMREIVGFVCESPRPWRADETTSPRIRSAVQRALRVRPHWATRLSELSWLLYDEVGLSAAKKLSGCSGAVHSIKHVFLGSINELGSALEGEDGLTAESKEKFLSALRREIKVCKDIKDYLVSQRGVRTKPKQLIRLNLQELNHLVRSVVEERKSWMAKLGITLELLTGKELGTETYAIDADKMRIHSAIRELLDNSLEAFQERKRRRKTITIKTRLIVDEVRGVQALQLCYRDTAGSIPADVRRRLFTGQRVLSAKKGGSGYGLTYIYDVVRQHDGGFDIKREPRIGTIFTITFPLPPKGGGRDTGPGVSVQRAEPPAREEKMVEEMVEEEKERALKPLAEPSTDELLPE